MSDVIIQANSSGSASVTLTAPAINAAATLSLPNQTGPLGYANIPPVGTKTSSYTLSTTDVGKYVQIGSGGSIVIPTGIFAEGDTVLLYNNHTSNITITCSALTTYISGINTASTSATLLTRGVASVLFISPTQCVLFGSVA